MDGNLRHAAFLCQDTISASVWFQYSQEEFIALVPSLSLRQALNLQTPQQGEEWVGKEACIPAE